LADRDKALKTVTIPAKTGCMVSLLRNGKAVFERPFTLHLQQPEKCTQNVYIAPPGKNYAEAHTNVFL